MFSLISACVAPVSVCKHWTHRVSALLVWCLGNFWVLLVLMRCVYKCVCVCAENRGLSPLLSGSGRAHWLAVRSAIMAGSCGVTCMRTAAQTDTHTFTRGLSLLLTLTHTCASTQAHILHHTLRWDGEFLQLLSCFWTWKRFIRSV